MRSPFSLSGIILLLLMFWGCNELSQDATPNSPVPFTETDAAAIEALEDQYVSAWLSNDTLAVFATLDPEVVLMPGGQEPLVGLDAIRAFWWPDDGSRTTITSYSSSLADVEGSGDLAVGRTRGELAFTYELDGQRSELTSTALGLTVYRRQSDGSWRIYRRMWAPLRP